MSPVMADPCAKGQSTPLFSVKHSLTRNPLLGNGAENFDSDGD